jgi:hypothetical protein
MRASATVIPASVSPRIFESHVFFSALKERVLFKSTGYPLVSDQYFLTCRVYLFIEREFNLYGYLSTLRYPASGKEGAPTWFYGLAFLEVPHGVLIFCTLWPA